MNNLLGLVLGALLLVAVFFWFNQNKSNGGIEKKIEEGEPIVYSTAITSGSEETIPQAAIMDVGEASMGQEQMEYQVHNYPMEEQMEYPSGILPGKVGTYHPTKDCDRFICNGCWNCSKGGSCGGQRTDDSERNYTELIDRIRTSQTSEYPFYKLA